MCVYPKTYSKNVTPILEGPYIPLPRSLLLSACLDAQSILIADDEAAIRRAVRAFIDVCEAVDGTEAFHKAVLLNPDLIVLDLSMPNANSVEVALLVRDLLPGTPVVLYTMFDEVFGKSPARTLGLAAIVPKSDGVATLLGRIEALLDAQDTVDMQGR